MIDHLLNIALSDNNYNKEELNIEYPTECANFAAT